MVETLADTLKSQKGTYQLLSKTVTPTSNARHARVSKRLVPRTETVDLQRFCAEPRISNPHINSRKLSISTVSVARKKVGEHRSCGGARQLVTHSGG